MHAIGATYAGMTTADDNAIMRAYISQQ